MRLGRQARALYAGLPLGERFHLWARDFSAPLEAVVARAPRGGRVADVGCGHGLVCAMLALADPTREVVGVDPDPRKVRWAQLGAGRLPNVRLREGSAGDVARDEPGAFDAAVVCDVLYLLPEAPARAFLADVRRLLAPGGTLLLQASEADGSWRERKGRLQERVMVQLLGRTHGSGAIALLTREQMGARLEALGFRVEQVVDLRRGYSTPHVLYVCRAV